MTESYEAYAARKRMEFFEAHAAQERRRVEAGELARDREEGRRMVARYEAKAAEWREELERLTRAGGEAARIPAP